MRAHKKSNRQGLGQESKTYFKPLAKTGNQFPLQSHSQLLGSTQLAGGFLSSPLLITPARAAALQLAQIEAQLALNHLSALSISSQANGNQVALLGLLRAAATSAGSPVPMYRPQGPDFNRPRHLMPVPVNQENHAIFTDYQRPPFPPAHTEEQDVSVYQRTGASSRHDAAQVMGQSSMPWNSARPTEDSLLPDSVSKVLASFGLNRKDLERLSQYPDSELTPEKLPAILLNLKGQNKACRVPQMTPAPAHPQVSMMPPQQSPNADPAPPTAVHPASYLSIATQVPGKVIEYGHASQEQHFIKRVPLPPPTTKCKAEPALNSKDSRSFMDDPRRPRSRSRDRSSHSPHSGKGPSSSSDWHNHSNSTGSKDHRNKYDDWKSQSHSSSRDHSSSPSRPGRHGHHSPARSTSHSQSSCSSPGRSPARHAHSRGPPPRVGERWCSPQRRSPYRHAQSHSQSPSPHHSQRLPSHPGRHRSPSPPGRRPHPHNSSSYVPTGGMSSRHFSHDRSRFPNDMAHKRAHDPRAHPSSSSPCSSLSSSSSRNSKRHSSPSLGRDRDKESDRRAAASRSTSSSQGRPSTSDRDRSSHGRPAASASSKTDPAQSSPSGSQSAKSKAKPKASDSKPVVETAGGKKSDPGASVTTEKIVWAKDERGIIMITGLPESGCAESDIVTLAAPYGVPTEVIVAAAECKAVVVLPERSSAEDMVKSPASIGSCELSLELLSVSVDISRPVTLFHAMMGPDKPCGALTAWNRLLVVSNVPDSPNGPTEVEQLIQRFGNISRSLALNHNKIIVEMESAASAQAVYQRFQKFPCIVQNNPLSFSMKPDAPGVMKVQEVKSETSGSQAAAAAAVAVAASSATPPANAADQATDASSSAATDTKQPGTSSTLPAAGPTKQHPACSSPGSIDGLTESQKSTVPNGDSEATTATAVFTERDSKGDGAGAPTAAFDLPNVSPALLQALLQECKSRAAMKMALETKERAKEAPAEKASEEARPEEGIPPDQEAEMEDDMACNMDDFVTVDEVGDFAEEASPSPGETSPVGTAEGTEDSTAMGHSPEETDLSSEKTDSCSKDTALSCEKTDACSNASDPSSEKTDPCSWEKDPSSEKKETCSQEADPSSEKTDSCSKETDPSSEKSDPCSEGTDPHFKQRDVGSEKTAASSERREPCSGEEDPSCSEKVEPSSDDTLIGVLQKEESKSRTPEAVTNDVNMLDDSVPEQTEEKMETENCTDSADMDGQKDEEEEVTQPAVLDANDCLKQGGGHSDTQTTSSVTMDAVAIVAQREEAGNTTENDTAKTTTSSTPHPTGELKRRRSQNGEEVETKRLRKDPIFPKDYSLVPFNPAHPIGMEFLESRTGFFCQVCAKFYCGDEEAKKNHCRTLKHYENLEISLQHWKKRPNTGPNGTAL